MQQWEYKMSGNQMIGLGQKGHNYTADLLKNLNELGKEGWEVVGFHAGKADAIGLQRAYVLLKRPVKK